MTATERLRAMLDERGVEWGNVRRDGSESNYLTEWQFDGNQGIATAIEWSVGGGLSVDIHRHHLTPEQAIAATLGRGECRNLIAHVQGQMPMLYCGECGCTTTLNVPSGGAAYSGETAMDWPLYCAKCGRAVKA